MRIKTIALLVIIISSGTMTNDYLLAKTMGVGYLAYNAATSILCEDKSNLSTCEIEDKINNLDVSGIQDNVVDKFLAMKEISLMTLEPLLP